MKELYKQELQHSGLSKTREVYLHQGDEGGGEGGGNIKYYYSIDKKLLCFFCVCYNDVSIHHSFGTLILFYPQHPKPPHLLQVCMRGPLRLYSTQEHRTIVWMCWDWKKLHHHPKRNICAQEKYSHVMQAPTLNCYKKVASHVWQLLWQFEVASNFSFE